MKHVEHRSLLSFPSVSTLLGERRPPLTEVYEPFTSTLGRIPWMGDQPDTRPLFTQESMTQKDEDKHP